MVYLQESGASIHRRRRRRRAAVTLTVVTLLLLGTFLYAAAYVQELVGNATPKPVPGAACRGAVPPRIVTPQMVTINVYNTTSRDGLAASVAESLQKLGFKVATVGNDPLSRTIQGVGEIRRGPTGDGGATLAATRLSGIKVTPDDRSDDSVDLVLGDKFRGLNAPRKAAKLKPAKVTTPC